MSHVFGDVTELLFRVRATPFGAPVGRMATYMDMGNVLVLLGAGTQGFFGQANCLLTSDEDVQAHFANDALLNTLAQRLEHDAGNARSRFAVVTLNVLWEFSHQFPFHGTIARNTVPEPNNTQRHLSIAKQYIEKYFVSKVDTHIVFVGIGMTWRNGKGFPDFLNHVYNGGVQSVTIVDPCDTITNTSSRRTWLSKECGMDLSTFPIHHVQKTAQEWLAPLRDWVPAFRAYTGPTQALFFAMLQSSPCARAHRTRDNVVRDLITWFIGMNEGLSFAEIPRASRRAAALSNHAAAAAPLPKPPKVISRMDASVGRDVVSLTPKRDPSYWVNQSCTRVLQLSNGIGYINGTIGRYNNDRWLLHHDDGDTEWLQEYEVILGVQLFHVRSQ